MSPFVLTSAVVLWPAWGLCDEREEHDPRSYNCRAVWLDARKRRAGHRADPGRAFSVPCHSSSRADMTAAVERFPFRQLWASDPVSRSCMSRDCLTPVPQLRRRAYFSCLTHGWLDFRERLSNLLVQKVPRNRNHKKHFSKDKFTSRECFSIYLQSV